MDKAQNSALIVKYKKALEENPSSTAFAPLAEAYRTLGLTEQALDVLKKGFKNHPEFVLGKICLANCYLDLNQTQMAYTTLKPYVKQNHDNLKLLNLFAQICESLNEKAQALEIYKQLLFISPTNSALIEKVTELEETQTIDSVLIEEKAIFDLEAIDSDPEDWSEVNLFSTDLGTDEIEEWSMDDFSSDKRELIESGREDMAVEILETDAIADETFLDASHSEEEESRKNLMDFYDEKMADTPSNEKKSFDSTITRLNNLKKSFQSRKRI